MLNEGCRQGAAAHVAVRCPLLQQVSRAWRRKVQAVFSDLGRKEPVIGMVTWEQSCSQPLDLDSIPQPNMCFPDHKEL